MTDRSNSHALDHVVLVLFENRSFDNLLGQLYGPGDGKVFDGILGKDLSNPVPAWAEHQPPDGSGIVKAHSGTSMDAPNPDSGEEWYHTNTQLFGVLDDANRFAGADTIAAPWNAPTPGQVPSMDGYSQIMQCYTPEQVPVLGGQAR